MILTWTHTCFNEHSACKSNVSRETPPARVIDVGSQDGKSEPRLCDTNADLGDYIALSHCWGGRQPLRTTKDNTDSMKSGIPFDQLPRTFQDAIKVTRGLGIKYLWIDSLCIVQDDTEDWEREAAKMATIFEAAYLTIAATAASNGSDGLFPRERGREFVMRGCEDQPHIFMREKRSEDCFLPRKLNTGLLSMDTLVDYSVDGLYPLQNRAWCFQELILSPRVLHFTHSEIVWHCRTKWDCECGAVKLGGSLVRQFNAILQNPPYSDAKDEFAESIECPKINTAAPAHSWHDIVSEFMSKQITFREDILPALSGTAKKFGLLRDGRYIAGLWEDNFAHDLSWHVPETGMSSRPNSYLGPSFSWCSCVSRIEWPNWTHDYTPRLETIELSSTTDGIDPTGKVSSASMKVKGRMTPAYLIFTTEQRVTSIVDPGMVSSVDQSSESSRASGNFDATSDKSKDATHLAPGDRTTWVECVVVQPGETLQDGRDIRVANRCRLDTVDDTCCASFYGQKKGTAGTYDPEHGFAPEFDSTRLKDLCADTNLVYCLQILESCGEGQKVFVALMLVPSSHTGPKTFKRIGIVYNMVEEFFIGTEKQEVTIT